MSTRPSHFPETRWSLIDAIKGGKSASFQALSEVCEIYWYPIYAFFRDERKTHHDAQDLTQGFFEGLLRRDDLATVDQGQGNFRAYLSAAARNFAINEYYRMKAAKRGCGQVMISYDEELADKLYCKEKLLGGGNPEVIYDKRWAFALLKGTQARLRAEARAKGKGEEFEALEDYLEPNGREAPFKDVAKILGKSEGAVRIEVFRIRRRYRDLLKLEIAKLVGSPEAVEEEIKYLVALMAKDSSSESDNWLLTQ